jgi:hypothetical protein
VSADKYRVHPEVLSRVLAGEAVLLDLQSGTYFGLNDVGTRVWELLKEPKTKDELRAVILAEYEVTEAELDADLERILGELVGRGLVVRE